jgi:hypothetical protein
MKRIRYMDQSWVVGDSIARTMMDFAAALAKIDASEHVRFVGIDANHHEVEVEFMLGPATSMIVESVDVVASEPDNSGVEKEMLSRIAMISAIGANSGI